MATFDDFIAAIKREWQPLTVILFGSRGRGEGRADSDYDLLIVSERFRGVAFTDRMTPFHRVWPLREDLECICLTPGEFERGKKMISITAKAVAEGLVL